MAMERKVLLVDDDPDVLEMTADLLRRNGYAIVTAQNGAEALERLQRDEIPFVVTDLRMPGMSGEQLLDTILQRHPNVQVIILTGYGTIPSAVEAIKKGAADYLTKPLSPDQLLLSLERLFERLRLEEENRQLREMLARQAGDAVILGESKAIRQVLSLIDKVAPTDATVLLQGESGVGKELVAKAIHFRSKRRHKPFVKVSCAAIPESLLEVELFGREKGAYTDATDAKPGRFELAHQGTMLLDEVGDLTPAMQAKLLRVLQEKEFERVGGTQTIRVDVRIIAATNKDLLAAVQKGEFREDLFYRLNVVPIYIPPLRERKEDIPILAEAFVARFCAEMEKPMMTIADDAMQVLLDYDWPGNVRELQNVLERAVILAEEPVIRARDLHFLFAQRQTGTNPTVFSLRHAEMEQILRVLKLTKGNKAEAARLLGITRDTLYRKLREYRLDPSQWKP
ncbi:MAG: hypothetical protein HZLCBSQH_000656 [Candidatus Fervidibacterota bacterium]